MNKPIIHDERCISRMARQAAFDLLWPHHCQACHAHGGNWYSFDPSPGGSRAPSLGPGTMEDFDTCACIDAGTCPRCAKPLNGPAWRPINLRERASIQLYRLASRLQHARPDELALRQLWWRSAALFRENPTPATWAVFHPIDTLWARLFDMYSRPSRAAQALFALQALLERGVYDERPCWSCGWNWGKHPGDGRELGDCECWIASWEDDEAKIRADLDAWDTKRAVVLDRGNGAIELLEPIQITLAPEMGEGPEL